MASGKWKDMSPEQQAAAEKQYGSRSAWKSAKDKAKAAKKDSPSAPSSNNNSNSGSSSKSYTDTNNGRIEAPSWYRNLDGSTPSTMGDHITQSGWEKGLDKARAEKAQSMANQKKAETINTMTQNAYKTGGYGEEWKEFSAGMSQQQKNATKKQIGERVKEMKHDAVMDKLDAGREARQYAGESSIKYGSARDAFASNKEKGDYYLTNPMHDDFEDYDNEAGENLADKMVASGHNFSWQDYNMNKNEGKKNSQYNYDAYGGYENWYNNHSVYSEGGFKGSNNVMSSSEVASAERDRYNKLHEYKMSDDYMKKYGNYDWAQNYYNRWDGKEFRPGVGANSYSHTTDSNLAN